LTIIALILSCGALVMGARAALPLPPSGTGGQTPAAASPRTLTVATMADALPLSGTGADGQAAGLHVRMARAVCERLRLDCRFTAMPADTLLDALASGAVDMVAADLIVTDERAARVRFAPAHARAASLLVGRAASWPDGPLPGAESGWVDGANPFDRLAGRIVVVAGGSDQAVALQRRAPRGAGAVLAPTHGEAVDALRSGDADAALLPLAIGLEALGDGLIPLGPPLTDGEVGGPVALATALGNRDLAQGIGGVVEAMRRDGRIRALARVSPDPLAAAPVEASR
jgi:ABC-type amino acid transport substrate-binding protein